MIAVTHTRPVPLSDEHSAHFWEAARHGRLLIQRCHACGTHQFYPRLHCAACLAPDPEWVASTGRGRLHTYSVLYRAGNPEFAGDCPYVFAIVELDEGPRVSTRIVETAPDRLRCDAPAVLVPPPAGDAPPLLCFRVEED